MPFHQNDLIRYYTFDSLTESGLAHAVFTRQGGVSPEPWASLNMGATVGDDLGRVIENRSRAFDAVGCAPETLFDVWQVHGADVVCAHTPRPMNIPHKKADAILTIRPLVTLFMRFADCVPILLYDPMNHAIGLVHAGWQGTVKQITGEAVRVMQCEFSSRPEDIFAAIGPSIGPHHYEVGQKVVTQVHEAFGQDASELLPTSNGAVQFDLWAANYLILENVGVKKIEISGICTACHLEDWYSHRGEGGKTGRFGVLIGLSG